MSTGIRNALMATPIGQAAIKQYAQGGEVEAEQIFEMAQTGASLEDILAGRARFFTTPRYRHAEVISDISDTLGLGTPIKKKREEEEQPEGDDAGGDPTELGLQDLAPGQNPNDPTFSQFPAPSLVLPAIAKGINLLEDATQYHTKRGEIKNPEFLIGDIPTLSKRADANVASKGKATGELYNERMNPTPQIDKGDVRVLQNAKPTVPTPLQESIRADITNRGLTSITKNDKGKKIQKDTRIAPFPPSDPLPANPYNFTSIDYDPFNRGVVNLDFVNNLLSPTNPANQISPSLQRAIDRQAGQQAYTQPQTAQELYGGEIPGGYDYGGTDQPSVDVQTQVDTFSEMSGVTGGDEAGSIGSDMDNDAAGWE